MDPSSQSTISVAHLGNSIQCFNDCPRLLETMLQQEYDNVTQDSCLRGGATLSSLWKQGNGMRTKFGTPVLGVVDIGAATVRDLLKSRRRWDYVIVNDHTQAPARTVEQQTSLQCLAQNYLPLLQSPNSVNDDDKPKATTLILLQTAAYRKPIHNSQDLGSFDAFTDKVLAGYRDYAQLARAQGVPVRIAPVGRAYQYLRQQQQQQQQQQQRLSKTDSVLWQALYARDDFHPSPHGTLFQTMILFATMTGRDPPESYQTTWWDRARYLQPPLEFEPLSLPTLEEASCLREVAIAVMWEVTREGGWLE